MDKPLDELYFDWLADQVGSGVPPHTYRKMLETLFFKEFVWSVPNDDNRAADGKDLRREFLEDTGITDAPEDWMWLGCSILELLIALSRRLAFEADGEPREWFWELIGNLTLDRFIDNGRVPKQAIDDILECVIWRTYKEDGTGGLFPLRFSQEDQRHVELWYQMSAYLLERSL